MAWIIDFKWVDCHQTMLQKYSWDGKTLKCSVLCSVLYKLSLSHILHGKACRICDNLKYDNLKTYMHSENEASTKLTQINFYPNVITSWFLPVTFSDHRSPCQSFVTMVKRSTRSGICTETKNNHSRGQCETVLLTSAQLPSDVNNNLPVR